MNFKEKETKALNYLWAVYGDEETYVQFVNRLSEKTKANSEVPQR